MANQNTAIPEVERAVETLPSLFTRLGDQLTQLFDAKLSLLRIELKEEIAAYLRGAIMIIVGAAGGANWLCSVECGARFSYLDAF